MDKMTHTGIIIINYHCLKDTTACLGSLAKCKLAADLKVYVVEPESKNEAYPDLPLKPVVIPQLGNLGFAWANNLGMKQAMADGCETLILLNNDTEVKDDFLAPLLHRLKDPKIGMVSPKIYFSPGREFHHDDYMDSERGKVIWYAGGMIDWPNVQAWHWGVNEVDHGQFTEAADTDFATGCCLGITKTTIGKIGLLDERYFLYLEDVDWSLRAKRAGLGIVFEPDSIIWHKNAGSTGGPGSATQVYYQTRNRIYFARRYAPFRTRLAVERETIRFIRNGPATVRQAAYDALWRHYGKANHQI